jgi:hypothetical protein
MGRLDLPDVRRDEDEPTTTAVPVHYLKSLERLEQRVRQTPELAPRVAHELNIVDRAKRKGGAAANGGTAMSVVTHRKILANAFLDALEEAGLLPDKHCTTRVVIDAKVGEPVTLTQYKLGDERLLGVARDGVKETDSTADAIAR